ncbi:MAG: hypothetical protein ACR2L6_02645 [Gemmatimonadaceae bacterium]
MSPRSLRAPVLLITAAVMLFAAAAEAQRPQVRIGLGTLLTRDRGWNYHESLEFAGALVNSFGPVDLEAGASLIRSFAEFSSPAGFAGPVGFRDGFSIRMHFRVPAARRAPLSALAGAEVVQDRTEDNPRTTTAGAMLGAGWNFGPQHRAALDLRYVAFARRLGTSRGILGLTLGWRL